MRSALLVLALAGCATVKQDVKAIAHGVLDCTKAAAPELVAETVALAIDLSDGQVDWQPWIDRAIADASGVKACALAEYRAAKVASSAGMRMAVLALDPLADGLARIEVALSVSQIVTSRGPL